ncbi:MAG: RNA-binding S4 domain-containing protein [Alphaproteobacteria bacterium]|nr:MAG: RNA-binding S4 domain-containing protein [Alphaproteobacteria bacterium]
MEAAPVLRIDKWLFHARFCRSRALAAALVGGGHVRLNGRRIDKPAAPVRVGDVLTLRIGGRVRLLRVLDLGCRRGPASEARLLYLELDGSDGA